MSTCKKKMAIVLTSLTILSFLFPSLMATPASDSAPIVLELAEFEKLNIGALTELSQDRGKPVLVYSSGPIASRMLWMSKTRYSFNQDTGDWNETLISSYTQELDLFEYHVIEAGNPAKHKTYTYLAQKGNSSYFLRSLEREIDSLREVAITGGEQQSTLSDFDGDYRGDDKSWLRDKWLAVYVAAWDHDGDGWVWKQRYQHEVHRSVYDYNTDWRWWTINLGLTSIVDSGDYKEDYGNWVGPWVHRRWNVIDDWNGHEWDNHPTSTISNEWSYSKSVSVSITRTGPSVGFGYSSGWSAESVKTVSHWDGTIMKWDEQFPPTNGVSAPNYGGEYPFTMTPPIDPSHNSFKSYRDALFHATPYSSFGFYWSFKTQLYRDENFGGAWFFPSFNRYSAQIVDSETIPNYPAS